MMKSRDPISPEAAAGILNLLADLAGRSGAAPLEVPPGLPPPKKARRGRGEGGIQQLPSGSYRATLSLGTDRNGKRIRETFTAPTKGGLLAAMRKRQVEIGPAGAVAERGLTVGQWFARWMASCEGRIGAASARVRRSRSRHVAAGGLADVPLLKLRVGHVAAWLAAMEEGGVPPGERAAVLSLLKTSLNEAVRSGLLTVSPADKARPPKRGKPDRRSLTPEQARGLIAAGRAEGLELYLALALDSGCRPGELLALRRCDLDGRVLCVCRSLEIVANREKAPKTEAGVRRIVLAPGTVARLAAEGGSDLLIPRSSPRGGSPYKGWLLPRFKRAAEAAGVPWATPYTTRHTTASLLLRAGVPIATVAQRLGHGNPAITLRFYAHAVPGDQERAALVTARLFGLTADDGTDPMEIVRLPADALRALDDAARKLVATEPANS